MEKRSCCVIGSTLLNRVSNSFEQLRDLITDAQPELGGSAARLQEERNFCRNIRERELASLKRGGGAVIGATPRPLRPPPLTLPLPIQAQMAQC